jgi:hypothetical protein
MTADELTATIRQAPGIREARRWWGRNGEERLYLDFSVSGQDGNMFVDLRCGIIFGYVLWREDPDGLGKSALCTVRILCKAYQEERSERSQKGSASRCQ